VSFADAQLNGELFGTRGNGRRQLRPRVYRRLEASNDYGDPLSFGSSLNAVLFGLDEGFYYRTWGAELAGSNVGGGGFTWRLFGEHQWNANVETQFSLANAMNDVQFMPNIEATEGTIGGAEVRYTHTFGLDPAGLAAADGHSGGGGGGDVRLHAWRARPARSRVASAAASRLR
jgi:hypothetical protein